MSVELTGPAPAPAPEKRPRSSWSNGIVSSRSSAIQPQQGASLMDSVMAAGEEALIASPVSSIQRMGELARAEGPIISAEDARQQIKDAGLTRLAVPDQSYSQEYLDIIMDRERESMKRAEIIGSAPQGAGATAARFGAGFAASMLDPINVASAFVPVVGQARYLKWLGKAGGFAGRTGVRAGVGAVEGVVGAAMVEPIIAAAKEQEQADYDSADSLANIAFGTVFGGGLHVMGGSGADLYRKVRGATNPWDLPELAAGREANAAVYGDIESQLLAAGRGADESAANASLVASAFRGLSEVTGRSVDDLYSEFGPRISFAREGEAAYAQGPSLRVADQLADSIGGRTFDQPAYHGTPHKVDQFSLQKIGSGEGAQAYGWGLYFAGKREVAEHYRKTLSDVTSETGAVIVRGSKVEAFSPEGHAARLLFYNDRAEIARAAKQWLKEAREGQEWAKETARGQGLDAVAYYERLNAFIAAHKRRDIQVVKGNLYKVELPEDEALLDNDAPISKQNAKVQEVAREFLREAGHLRAGENGPRQLSSSFAAAAMELGGMVRGGDGQTLYAMLAKKLGGEQAASMYLAERGVSGMRYKAGQIANVKGGGTNYVIWDEAAIGAPESLYQMRGQDKRGSIDLAKGRRVNITLFQKADRSTFVHETGHLFLEVLDSLASKADAPEALKADLAKAREWMGLKDGEAIGEKHHEQFARGFEAYLREGKAPTPKLTKIFERFADWLVKIYKDIRALDVTLSDDVRGVYDRIIAGYPAAKKVELAGPAKREAALRASVAQAVRGKQINGAEAIINGDAEGVKRAAQNEVDSLAEPPPKPLEAVDDDTSIESARESLGEIEALIKASGDEAVIRELDDLDEIVTQARTWASVAKKLAPCIGATDG